MSKFTDICDKLFFGGYSKQISKNTWINFPKTAFYMVPGILMAGMFQSGSIKDIPVLFWIGIGLIGVGVFSFFYPGNKQKKK